MSEIKKNLINHNSYECWIFLIKKTICYYLKLKSTILKIFSELNSVWLGKPSQFT